MNTDSKNTTQALERKEVSPQEAFKLANQNWLSFKCADTNINPGMLSRLMKAQVQYSGKELKDLANTPDNEEAEKTLEGYIKQIYINLARTEYRNLLEETTPSPDIVIGNIRDHLIHAKVTDYSVLNLKEYEMAKTSGQIEQDLRDILTEFERDKPKNFRPPGQISSHQALIVVKSPSLGNEVD
jgi:hypothetical protein